MEKIIELEHRGITLRAPHEVVVDSILARLATPMVAGLSVAGTINGRPGVGQFWAEEGGLYLGDIVGENEARGGPLIGCIDAAGIFADIAYGQYGTQVPGADWKRDGRANTVALAKAGNEFAIRALDLSIGGKKDWHWPAQCELNLGFINGGDHYAKATHWSSTQGDATCAWYQIFGGGYQSWLGKHLKFSAFVVRRG